MALIELPFPAKILWPNGRGHHMKKHREFQKHKEWAFKAALAVLPTCFKHNGSPVQLTCTVYPKTRNEIDEDNAAAAMKAYQDGIALAMKTDDSCFKTPRIHFGEPVKHGRVVIAIGAA